MKDSEKNEELFTRKLKMINYQMKTSGSSVSQNSIELLSSMYRIIQIYFLIIYAICTENNDYYINSPFVFFSLISRFVDLIKLFYEATNLLEGFFAIFIIMIDYFYVSKMFDKTIRVYLKNILSFSRKIEIQKWTILFSYFRYSL